MILSQVAVNLLTMIHTISQMVWLEPQIISTSVPTSAPPNTHFLYFSILLQSSGIFVCLWYNEARFVLSHHSHLHRLVLLRAPAADRWIG
jgi:hypothetical protein